MEIIEEIDKKSIELTYNVDIELNSLIKLFSIQNPSGQENFIRKYILAEVKKLKKTSKIEYNVDSYGNVLITKGTLKTSKDYYPCLVAHMDSVFELVAEYKVNKTLTSNGETKLYGTCAPREIKNFNYSNIPNSKTTFTTEISNNTGIGGDDKCGIWLALKLLKELPILKIVFTVEEEIGGKGAEKVDMKFFNDVGYIIEGDRKGYDDVITNIYGSTCSREFKDIMLPLASVYGYSENYGMYTDIETFLSNGVDVSCINLSVGYYNPHTNNEFVIVEDLLKATQFVKELIYSLGYNRYEHILYDKFNSRFNYNHYALDDELDWYSKSFSSCGCTPELVDLGCDLHNPVINTHTNIMCSCGEELIEKEFNFYCPFCNKTYLYDYR